MRLSLKRMGSLAVVAALALCLAGCAKADEQTQAVIDRIDAIGEVTLGSKADIESIRKDYDKLPDDQVKFVENLDTLESAEDKIGDLEAKAKASQTTTTGKTASSVGPVPQSHPLRAHPSLPALLRAAPRRKALRPRRKRAGTMTRKPGVRCIPIVMERKNTPTDGETP